MRSGELRIACDNDICDERGDRPRCYLSSGNGHYKNCVKYEYWRVFKERHDKLQGGVKYDKRENNGRRTDIRSGDYQEK